MSVVFVADDILDQIELLLVVLQVIVHAALYNINIWRYKNGRLDNVLPKTKAWDAEFALAKHKHFRRKALALYLIKCV